MVFSIVFVIIVDWSVVGPIVAVGAMVLLVGTIFICYLHRRCQRAPIQIELAQVDA